MTARGPTHFEGRGVGWAGHHPTLCELNAEGIAVVYERMGCKLVSVERPACVSRGAPACLCVVRWSP